MEPERNSDYRALEYWETRYSKDERPNYEWFMDCGKVEELVKPYLTGNILDVGCGNSDLAFRLAQQHAVNVTAIDFSSVAIERAKNRLSLLQKDTDSQQCDSATVEHPNFCGELNFLVQDVTNLSDELPDNYFDLVIDKGTLDALVAEDSSPLFPSPQVIESLDLALQNIARIMKPSGRLVSLTLGQPHFRLQHYKRTMDVEQVQDLGFFFLYTMRKPKEPSTAFLLN